MSSCWTARPGGTVRTPSSSGSTRRRSRKLAAARDYTEMRAEVEAAIGRYGRQAFAMECLRPAAPSSETLRFERELPDYERMGRAASARAAMPKSSATATTCARSPWRSRPRNLAGLVLAAIRRRLEAGDETATSVASAPSGVGEAIEPPDQLLNERHTQPIAARLSGAAMVMAYEPLSCGRSAGVSAVRRASGRRRPRRLVR